MQDFSLQITKSRRSVQRKEERVREGETRGRKKNRLVETAAAAGNPQTTRIPTAAWKAQNAFHSFHKADGYIFFKTLPEARSTLNTLLFGPKGGEHLRHARLSLPIC